MKTYIRKHFRNRNSSLILPMFLLLLLFSSCKGGSQSQSNPGNSNGEVSFQTHAKGSHSNYDQKTEMIITSTSELDKVFSKINSNRQPKEPVLDIDFSERTVAFITAGQLSTGGFTVEVDRIEDTDTERIIYIGGTSPKPGDNVTMVLTSPFTMISFEKTELPIRFEYKRK
ncbi:protease complex subunit PrcB family protein [Flavobacteriaceae bacterium TK19130]|nr:protease complex subunit PrcB family protein [Thermobacterium salinum]